MSVTAVPIRPIKKGSLAKLWIGLGALALAAAAIAWAGTRDQVAMSDPAAFLANNAKRDGVTTTASGLQIMTIRAGTGPRIGVNDGAVINYEGRLLNGTIFDTTKGKQPAPMLVQGVVPGFSEALQMMQPGGQYRIWLPPELAYGAQVPPDGPIPPNAVLDFDVEILQVVPNAAQQMGGGGLPPGM